MKAFTKSKVQVMLEVLGGGKCPYKNSRELFDEKKTSHFALSGSWIWVDAILRQENLVTMLAQKVDDVLAVYFQTGQTRQKQSVTVGDVYGDIKIRDTFVYKHILVL